MGASFTGREFAAALVERLGSGIEAVAAGSISITRAAATRGDGWTITLTATGVRQGTFAAWIDRAGAVAIGQLVLGSEDTPDDPSIVDALREMWSQAASALCLMPPFAGLKLAVAGPLAGAASAGSAQEFAIGVGTRGTAQVSVSGSFDVEEPAAVEDRSNLDLVLDIELPLTVRFGRTIMSLKALADLGPGCVVDMGRSPDDPVELLISDRVFAKGEVVVVGGNYGVRVTDLVGAVNRNRNAETQA